MKKKLGSFIILFSIVLLSFNLDSSHSETVVVEISIDELGLSEEELAFLDLNRKFYYSIENNYQPIEYLDKRGSAKGLGVAYLEAAAQILNVEFELYVNQDKRKWNESLSLLQDNQIDLLPTASYTEERSRRLFFSEPYYTENLMAIGHKGAEIIYSIEDLDGRTVGFPKGYWQIDYFKSRYPNVDIIEMDTIIDVLDAVDDSRCSYTLLDESVYVYFLQNEGYENLYKAGHVELQSEHRMAFSKENKLLAQVFNKLIAKLPKEDIFKSAFFMEKESYHNDLVWTFSLILGGLFVTLLLFNVTNYIRNARYIRKMLENRSELIQNLSHDLRTPLATLQANIGLLKHGIVLNEDHFIQKIEGNIENLNHIIEELNVVSGENNTEMYEIEKEIEALKWLEDVYSANVTRFSQEGVDLIRNFDNAIEGVQITIKTYSMTRALENILSNAIKHSPKNSHVLMSSTINEGKLQISVTDKGAGVKQTERRAIFERFYRGGNSQSYSGKGLGLSIAQSIVKSHEGHIRVESKPNVNTTFTIVMPISNTMKN